MLRMTEETPFLIEIGVVVEFACVSVKKRGHEEPPLWSAMVVAADNGPAAAVRHLLSPFATVGHHKVAVCVFYL